jgi:hypothetical protein
MRCAPPFERRTHLGKLKSLAPGKAAQRASPIPATNAPPQPIPAPQPARRGWRGIAMENPTLNDFHLGNLPPQPYDAALVERCRLANLVRGPWQPKAPQVPPVFVPPANVAPVRVASAFLSHELASKPAPVAILMAGAAKFGIKESTLRRAKKALSIRTVEREDGFYWAFAGQVAGQ